MESGGIICHGGALLLNRLTLYKDLQWPGSRKVSNIKVSDYPGEKHTAGQQKPFPGQFQS